MDAPKKIWLVNYYAMPPHLESRLRTIKFAHYLKEKGYEVKIFASSFMHNTDINLIEDHTPYIEKQYDDLQFVHIRTKPYKNNGIARFISLFQFHLKLYFMRNRFFKPDAIVHTALPPFGNIFSFAAKKLKAKYIAEVLDLWPESFVELGLIKKNNPVLPLLYKSERKLYERADAVVFSMEGGRDYIKDKKWDTGNGGKINLNKVFYINNGIDLEDFENNKKNFIIEDEDLGNPDTKKVIYLGSIRTANNLSELIKAAETIKHRTDIIFLIYGNGDHREYLENYCLQKELHNVRFKEKWIEPQYVPFVVSQADVNILNYMSGSFGNYGGSQSKMFQYMAAGKPICCNLKMMYCQINKNKLGIARAFKDHNEYAEAIIQLADLDENKRAEIEQNAKSAVQEFDYKNLTNKLLDLL